MNSLCVPMLMLKTYLEGIKPVDLAQSWSVRRKKMNTVKKIQKGISVVSLSLASVLLATIAVAVSFPYWAAMYLELTPCG